MSFLSWLTDDLEKSDQRVAPWFYIATFWQLLISTVYIWTVTHKRKENLGYQIPSGVSQGQVMFSSTFLFNCRCLKPCIKLTLIKLVSLTNHQFVEKKKKCPVISFSIFNVNIWISFQKLKLTAVLIWFVPVMLIAVKPGQTPAPCP